MSIPGLEDCYLDHIAVAVSSLEEGKKVYSDLGLVFEKTEVVEDQQVTTSFAAIDERAHIELLEPIEGKGPIGAYLEKKGPGLHHLCFRVPDINQKMKELKDKGYRLLYEEARQGANQCLVNFIHPKSAGGVLIEISQKRGEA